MTPTKATLLPQLANQQPGRKVASLRFDAFAKVFPANPLPSQQEPFLITYKTVGLVFAASLWDAQRRTLNAVLGVPRVDTLMELVVLADLAVRAVVVVYFTFRTYQFFSNASMTIELSLFGQVYSGLVILSLVIYNGERLTGRCVSSTAAVEKDCVPWEICGREPMTTPKAIVVVFVHVVVSASVIVAVLSAASTLEGGRSYDRAAFDVLVLLLVSELLYAQSRLKTFHEISEQSSTAAKIAGFHTLYTLCLVVPLAVAYMVYLSSLY
tara:strand:- start:1260 stop:2063 length:804 start_codon:yes stop_codon:yes gene_type:complete